MQPLLAYETKGFDYIVFTYLFKNGINNFCSYLLIYLFKFISLHRKHFYTTFHLKQFEFGHSSPENTGESEVNNAIKKRVLSRCQSC